MKGDCEEKLEGGEKCRRDMKLLAKFEQGKERGRNINTW
jgi:hypothetical protein